MAMLLNAETGERVVLRGNHVFGRNPSRSDTRLDDLEVSLMHAVARWRDGAWTLADHSRNGSFVDGRALVPGESARLAPGQELRFGPDRRSVWRVIDVAPPGNALLPVDPARALLMLGPHNLLPTSDAPALCIYEASPGQWILEQHGEMRALADGDRVEVGADLYRFLAVADIDDTRAAMREPSAPPQLTFRLSLDEEHAWMEARCGARQVSLGERSHHYVLATLARRRLADQAAGYDSSAQGWLASVELARMLGIDVPHLNIQVFRARDQVMSALPHAMALAGLIERRRGELRLGEFAFEILRGSGLEGRYQPCAQTRPDAVPYS